jgi:adenosylcobyric acid synthase
MLMVQGTSSSVGKSLLVAGLCRIFARQGLRVAPFKAQNMSNNAAVCADGSEIGRAQALQAAAAGIPPTADMNPVLLKPEADCQSQVIVLGKVWKTLPARHYYERKQFLWAHVTGALERLRSAYDLVIAEGAGSPVELNLKSGDIVNMAIARHAGAPVLLVGDIDRGGLFAQLLGTLDLLSPEERALVKGLIVNKFRGDPALFVDGVRILAERGGVPVLGVVPYLPNLDLPDEDAVAIEGGGIADAEPAAIEIAVIRLPHIANFDDFDPLESEPGVRLRYVDSPSHLGQPHAVVLPGTKSTMSDLRWLRERGLGDAMVRLRDLGAAIVGICGGYQMLGNVIRDPQKIESDITEIPGLGLLPVDTIFAGQKATHQVRARVASKVGWMARLSGISLMGYEIHMGQTATSTPWIEINTRGDTICLVSDGAASQDGRVWGCYLHGLFANDEFRRAWLSSLRADFRASPTCDSARLQLGLDRWADAVAKAIPVAMIEQIIAEGAPR